MHTADRTNGSNRATGIATDLALSLDPSLLMERMGMQPDPWQARLLRSNAKRILLNVHRQAGKSTSTGALAAHTAAYKPGSLVLLLSPSLRQSSELFRKALDAYHAIGGSSPSDVENKLTLELTNGSRIISLPGKEETIRGYSGVDLLIVDEASRVLDGLYYTIRPMLAVSNGRLVALTTPAGKRGWFFTEWSGPEPWERFEARATECSRISPEFLEEERKALGPHWFGQEYMCQFEDNTDQLFSSEIIQQAVTHDVKPLFGAAYSGSGSGSGINEKEHSNGLTRAGSFNPYTLTTTYTG